MWLGFALAGTLAAAGCSSVKPPGKSILSPAQMTPQAVALDIFFVRVPWGDDRVNGSLWREIDEQLIAADVRRELGKNGFRAGVVAGSIPTALTDLMDLSDKRPVDSEEMRLGPEELAKEPAVTRRYLQIRPDQRNEIITSGLYDELPVLVCEDGQLCGQTYKQAQGVLALKTRNERDGRVRLELIPEVQYGEPRQRWVGNQGVLRLEAGRAKRAFENLAMSVTLSPGQILVMTSLPSRSGSVGHHFFADKASAGASQQKLLLVRLAQTQHDDLTAQPIALPPPDAQARR